MTTRNDIERVLWSACDSFRNKIDWHSPVNFSPPSLTPMSPTTMSAAGNGTKGTVVAPTQALSLGSPTNGSSWRKRNSSPRGRNARWPFANTCLSSKESKPRCGRGCEKTGHDTGHCAKRTVACASSSPRRSSPWSSSSDA